ncbi:hypothetical protein PAPYR_4132 [Paratrimastix pyriformis]|uniref:Uncharacterized protein n=1 Tax=Paratrimastix pyriformis TaxID=342808 RepID=A0ABQ8UQW4_9EUKA|nr:hypothetical protein PAPYR_4132 [Paratrimastix pyriformis]
MQPPMRSPPRPSTAAARDPAFGAFIEACTNGITPAVAKSLKEHPEFANRRDTGRSRRLCDPPIVFAATNGHLDVVALLLDHPQQERALAGLAVAPAAANGHLPLLRLFAERGITSPYPEDLLSEAAVRGNLEIMQYLLSGPYKLTPSWKLLEMPCMAGHTEMAELLLRHPAVIPSANSIDPLWNAVDGGHPALVERLLEVPFVRLNVNRPRGWATQGPQGEAAEGDTHSGSVLALALSRGEGPLAELLRRVPGAEAIAATPYEEGFEVDGEGEEEEPPVPQSH